MTNLESRGHSSNKYEFESNIEENSSSPQDHSTLDTSAIELHSCELKYPDLEIAHDQSNLIDEPTNLDVSVPEQSKIFCFGSISEVDQEIGNHSKNFKICLYLMAVLNILISLYVQNSISGCSEVYREICTMQGLSYIVAIIGLHKCFVGIRILQRKNEEIADFFVIESLISYALRLIFLSEADFSLLIKWIIPATLCLTYTLYKSYKLKFLFKLRSKFDVENHSKHFTSYFC